MKVLVSEVPDSWVKDQEVIDDDLALEQQMDCEVYLVLGVS